MDSEKSASVVSNAVEGHDRERNGEPLLLEVSSRATEDEQFPTKVQVGMACYAISAFFFSIMAVFVKLAGRQLRARCSELGEPGDCVPVWEIIFFRSTVVMAFSLPQILRAGDNPFGNRRLLLSFRGFTGFASNSALFFAVQHIPLADMSVITFLTPIFVAIVSPVILKEALAKGSLLTCFLCMAGVMLVAQPSFLFGKERFTLYASVIALAHPILSACAKAAVRLLTATETNMVIVFYLSLYTMVGSGIGMLIAPVGKGGGGFMVLTWYEAFLVFSSGLCACGVQSFMNMGLRRVRAAQAMTMSYTGIVWSAVCGALIFKEYPNLYSGLGDLLIICTTLTFALQSTGLFSRKQRAVVAPAAADPLDATQDARAPLLPPQLTSAPVTPQAAPRGPEQV